MSDGEAGVTLGDAAPAPGSPAGKTDLGLHRSVLGDLRVFGQSVAGIGPSLGAASLVPLAYATAAGAGWLTVAIGTVGILFVAGSIAILARHYASAGALYNLNPQGLGPWAGALTGANLIALVLLIIPLATVGCALSIGAFASSTGIATFSNAAYFVTSLIVVGLAAFLAYFDIRLSTSLFLIIELISMVLIIALLVVVLAHSPRIFDNSQLTLHGATAHGTLVGVVFIVLVFVGFEGATSLGLESRNPRRAVPIALLGAVLTVGVFDTFNAYVQSLGFSNLHLSLAASTSPLTTLANRYHASALADIVLVGVAFSWFAALLSWFVYGPRVFLTMSRERLLPRLLTTTSKRHGSPVVAVTISFVVCAAVLVVIFAASYSWANIISYFGSFTGYCAALEYFLVGGAVIAWTYRRGRISVPITLCGLGALAVMGLTFYYSFNPLPPYPLRGYIWAFFGVVVLGLVSYAVLRWRRPDVANQIGTTREDLTAETPAGVSQPEPSL